MYSIIEFISKALVPLSVAISILSVAVGIWLSLREYRLKVKAETRLAKSAEVEAQIKLLKLFTEIMNIAHARGESLFSEKRAELMSRPEIVNALHTQGYKIDFDDLGVITLPIGAAAQDAAIAAVGELGKRHEILRPVAKQALESLVRINVKKEISQSHLDRLLYDGDRPTRRCN